MRLAHRAVIAPPQADPYFMPVHEKLGDIVNPENFIGRAPQQVIYCGPTLGHFVIYVYFLRSARGFSSDKSKANFFIT